MIRAEDLVGHVSFTYAACFAGRVEVPDRPSSGTTVSQLIFTSHDRIAAMRRRVSSCVPDILLC